MRKDYNMELYRLYRDGKISLEYAHELRAKHRQELDKRRKFKQGAKIESLAELLEQTWVMWNGKTMHIKAVKCWQLCFVERLIQEGSLFTVELNNKIDKTY